MNSRCDLIFAAQCEAACVQAMAQRLSGQPVLTIGDTPGFAQAGGIVELQNRDNRVSFVINDPKPPFSPALSLGKVARELAPFHCTNTLVCFIGYPYRQIEKEKSI
jgi:hypothetical protein